MDSARHGPEDPNPDVCILLTTFADADSAADVIEKLVEGGHAACGTILPGATSIYRWQGAIERESEVVVLLKTTAAAQLELLEKAKQLHPYDVPELLVLPVEHGDADYLSWVARQTTGGTPGEAVPRSE